MPTELERQVAEAVDENGDLRWPLLSRECLCCEKGEVRLTYTDTGNYAKTIKCPDCHGSGWVPDVTLDKVRELLHRDETQLHSWLGKDGVYHYRQYAMDGEYEDGLGSTDLEAACAALIASVQ